ncbi:polysaccharide pyruvyl transferase family protein [Rhodococcus oxybenzonivorans]|uniref:polysaccharide pyruvyl transferase family protein n=1 Tax=Rhodococcus oxybenzonivorans TaxID=1990687 RepID=UPI0029530A35|nr:polysaccharide pyruvyl transferase family protein [Rhodococcus oxybenzonivorans]MDV7354471.1 polysaccharide pyruvyl transferase family protein [Rhodococcus oxybenzonivorans]
MTTSSVGSADQPFKILVLWADSESTNLGLRALAEGVREVASRAWGSDCEMVFHTHASGATPLQRKKVLADFGRSKGPVKSEIRKYDIVLDTGGGDSFTDIYGLRRLVLMAYVHRAAKKSGVPLVLMPQTIGPFHSLLGNVIGTGALRRMTAVFARDPVSADYSMRRGRPVDGISTDLVFALPIPEAASSSARDVIVNVSGLLWAPNSHVDFSKYRESTFSLIDALISRGRRVSVLAHVLDSDMADNDVPAARSVAEYYGSRVELLVPGHLSEARSLMATAELVIGARMHACLNALSVGTPAIPWAYSRKFEPLLSALGWDSSIELKTVGDAATATMAVIDSLDPETLLARTTSVRARSDQKMEDLVAQMQSLVTRQSVS